MKAQMHRQAQVIGQIQGIVVWILSTKVVVFKLLNMLPEDRDSVPSRRVHGALGTPSWCFLAHVKPLPC